METYAEQKERERIENEARVEKQADEIRSRDMNKTCGKCGNRFLTNNVQYNQGIGTWEHISCLTNCITQPRTIAQLRESIQQTLPRNTSRMMAPSSGRKPGFYIMRTERQKIIDVVIHSLSDLDADLVVTDSFLS